MVTPLLSSPHGVKLQFPNTGLEVKKEELLSAKERIDKCHCWRIESQGKKENQFPRQAYT
jgi:hypothetical protein